MCEKEIFSYLKEIGCCKCCCVRYICSRFQDISDIDAYIQQEKLQDISDKEIVSSSKRFKTGPCVICLGLLQDFCINQILDSPKLNQVREYDSNTFTCAISMPACIMLRERSIRINLEEKFPEYLEKQKEEVPLNKAWKIIIKDKLGSFIGKTFENSDVCDFSINIGMDYVNNEEELAVLKDMQPKMFEMRKVQHRKFSGEMFSRKAVMTAIEMTPLNLFKMFAKVPPEAPSDSLTCKTIECNHNPIYFAGRYCKYSRELSQSPWIIDGVKAMETSVQELIFEQICNVFGVKEDNLKFSSSGREDCDVRCVGKGRPFYVEIANPKKTNYSFDNFRELEQRINVTSLIKVKDLQMVQRNDLFKIKEGEETKTKEYNALCCSKIPVTQEMLDKINNYGRIEIRQKTPIRVLHRRPLAVRNKTIYKMVAKEIQGRNTLFELEVLTQAGTYVKEFVHGDFSRTKPNVGEIIGTEVDILALDVTAINLDWPKEISQ